MAFSYSDVSYGEVMHKAAIAMAEGADFILLGATYTMLKSKKPVIAVCAVRTGAGKSQTTRKIADILKQQFGKKIVVVRHPMPYGDLSRQVVQRLSAYEDFELNKCTIEEREEYEPLIERGIVVYAGIDYGRILERAESEADIIIWDGGNNDTPFYAPDLHIVVFDPHRAGHELLYYPGETNMIMADVAIINKVDTAPAANVEKVRKNIAGSNPRATIILSESPIVADSPERIRGRRVLVVEDGPSITHGGMPFGAATIAARKFGAARNRGSAAVCGGVDQGHLRTLSSYRKPIALHGLLGAADNGPGGNDKPRRLRPGGLFDPGGPGLPSANKQAGAPDSLRIQGPRPAFPKRRARAQAREDRDLVDWGGRACLAGGWAGCRDRRRRRQREVSLF